MRSRAEHVVLDWSMEQKAVIDRFDTLTSIAEANHHDNVAVSIQGEPGCGKTAVLIEIACQAAAKDLFVLILCPTNSCACV